MRNYQAGTISDAIASAIEAVPDKTHRQVAEFLGIRPSTLSYGMDPSEDRPGGLGAAYLHRLADRWPEAATPLAQHFSELAGGVFQPVELRDTVTSLYSLAGASAKECGEAQAAMLRAAEHHSRGNCDDADREIDEAVQHLLSFKAAMRAERGAA